jgi:hypothetical protein
VCRRLAELLERTSGNEDAVRNLPREELPAGYINRLVVKSGGRVFFLRSDETSTANLKLPVSPA